MRYPPRFKYFHCGDRVARKDDPAHEGRVEAVWWPTQIKVKWDNGWIEHCDPRDDDLTVVEHAQLRLPIESPKQTTIALSPRRKLEARIAAARASAPAPARAPARKGQPPISLDRAKASMLRPRV